VSAYWLAPVRAKSRLVGVNRRTRRPIPSRAPWSIANADELEGQAGDKSSEIAVGTLDGYVLGGGSARKRRQNACTCSWKAQLTTLP
jgi:hypothetical protein